MMHASEARIHRIAVDLGELLTEVVFIGGSITYLLHTDSPFDGPRPTNDVDVVVATSTYAALGRLHDRLREKGFRQAPVDAHHVHRWLSPRGDRLDLVPAGDHLGGTGQLWDVLAIATAVSHTLDESLTIRHASAPAFLALKWAAFADRGAHDPLVSHDLEDILALVAARPSLPDEVGAAPSELRHFVSTRCRALLEHADLEDLLGAHLNNAQDRATVRERVRERLTRLAR